ncbi:biopolymer transporter ExbD [Luteitalea sp. TBR-22]|uniref:biopolymer transporter ExbD n=1 Tax=Luteitalea sp. TBR-22 TaxID=2802971 RepID=UPI001EF662E3|nr:biopolymer transporter ExbD [Luteitalea sp. TBR-22]
MPKVQAAGGGGMGRGRRGRMVATTALAEINVVPLVDVMLVLLIIFMVAAPMMTRGLDVNLPVARRSQNLSNERVFVTIPLSFGQDRRVQLNEEFIRVDVLGERMRQTLQGKSDKSVYLRADGAVTVQQTMTVMDALKAAGVEKVGLVSRLPGER